MKLPRIVNNTRKYKSVNQAFAGINHQKEAHDGEIYDDMNITSEDYPLLSNAKGYAEFSSVPNGIIRAMKRCGEKLYVFSSWKEERSSGGLPQSNFYHLYSVDVNTKVATKLFGWGEATERYDTFYSLNRKILKMGDWIIVLPDMVWYDTTATEVGFGKSFGTLYSSSAYVYPGRAERYEFTRGAMEFGNAKVTTNTITVPYDECTEWLFVDDAISISVTANEETKEYERIIKGREESIVSGTKVCTFTFTDESFEAQTYAEVSLERKCPQLRNGFVYKNRLWGYNDSTIYASRLGDSYNFFNYESNETSSWTLDVFTNKNNYLGYKGNTERITGCCFYNYPTFFSKDRVIRIYGDYPSTFSTSESSIEGCIEDNSIATANETLFYLGNRGIFAYSGSVPTYISEYLGETKILSGMASSDGRKYYLSANDQTYTFDSEKGVFHRIDKCFETMEYNEKLYGSVGNIIYTESDDGVEYSVEFADFYDYQTSSSKTTLEKKRFTKIQIRMELVGNSSVYIQYDSNGEWEKVRDFSSDVKRMFNCVMIPRRCDHFRIKLVGNGKFTLYAISREYSKSSYINGEGIN